MIHFQKTIAINKSMDKMSDEVTFGYRPHTWQD